MGSSRPTASYDVICQVHAFTRRHLEACFEITQRMDMESSSIHRAEDVIVSFTASGLPVLEDVGYLFKYPRQGDSGIATHKRDGFFDYRRNLYLRVGGNRPDDTGTPAA